jgi:hypothetical protein
MNLQQDDAVNKPKLKVFRVQEVLFQRSHEEINIGGCHPGSHGFALNLKVIKEIKEEVVLWVRMK